jgi:caa(3)-type oxidase subunit IV
MAHDHHVKLQHPTHHHVEKVGTYMKVFATLIILMGLTIGVYFWMPTLGDAPWVSYVNNVIAMTIACIKASIVIYIFMGFKHSTNLVRLYAVLGFVWVTLMTITFCDYASRKYEPTVGWEGQKETEYIGVNMPEQGDRPYDPPVLQK